jgi:hypothetical protein
MYSYITQVGIQIILIDRKEMYVPVLTSQLTYPPGCMRAASKSDKENPQN